MTILPPATSVSLFAKARFLPALTAESVGKSPATPTIALTTVSAFSYCAAANMPSFPPITFIFVSASDIFSISADFSSSTPTISGINSLACFSSSSMLLFAVNAHTLIPCILATSSVCTPIEPVEPNTDIFIFSHSHYNRHIRHHDIQKR